LIQQEISQKRNDNSFTVAIYQPCRSCPATKKSGKPYMKILHTSDWHLGATLCGRKRYDESEAFLTWLTKKISTEKVETLIVAGDIFDTVTPSNRALELYYQFLGRVSRSGCRHIIITAGNHDSPTLLSAPKELLSALDIHVIGTIPKDPADEVLILNDDSNEAALIICAVPFLRDKDVITAEAGEGIDEKRIRFIQGICAHYHDICVIAANHQTLCGGTIPIIATGHLFTAGGSILGDDGVRDLSIGNLVQIGGETFPECIDYLALGHLHQPQIVGGNPHRRYSGAPLNLGFGESEKAKEVVIVDITQDKTIRIEAIQVPKIRNLIQISGNLDTIISQLSELRFHGKPGWIEVQLQDTHVGSNAREEINKNVEGSSIEVLKIKTGLNSDPVIDTTTQSESLEELNPMEVFRRCLMTSEEPIEQWDNLTAAYQEILTNLQEGDVNAE
jgi:exonuclease SbcD